MGKEKVMHDELEDRFFQKIAEPLEEDQEKTLHNLCKSLEFLDADTKVVAIVKDFIDKKLLYQAWYTLRQYKVKLHKEKGIKNRERVMWSANSYSKILGEAATVAKAFNADAALLEAIRERDCEKLNSWIVEKERKIFELNVEGKVAEDTAEEFEVFVKPVVKNKAQEAYEIRMKEKEGSSLLLGTFPNEKLALLFFQLLKEHNDNISGKKK